VPTRRDAGQAHGLRLCGSPRPAKPRSARPRGRRDQCGPDRTRGGPRKSRRRDSAVIVLDAGTKAGFSSLHQLRSQSQHLRQPRCPWQSRHPRCPRQHSDRNSYEEAQQQYRQAEQQYLATARTATRPMGDNRFKMPSFAYQSMKRILAAQRWETLRSHGVRAQAQLDTSCATRPTADQMIERIASGSPDAPSKAKEGS